MKPNKKKLIVPVVGFTDSTDHLVNRTVQAGLFGEEFNDSNSQILRINLKNL
jgi:hypothetical protein